MLNATMMMKKKHYSERFNYQVDQLNSNATIARLECLERLLIVKYTTRITNIYYRCRLIKHINQK